MPKLSIITINLNNLAGLQKTMQSVFGQTFTDYEYIVIDGDSVDGSKEYIEQHADRLTYWVSEKDHGIYEAMNKGIRKSSGEYLLFLNSGDFLIENKVLFSFMFHSGKEDLIYGSMLIEENGELIERVGPEKLTFSYFLKGTLPHQSTLIRRKLFFEVGFYNEDLKSTSDWEFFMNAICKFNVSYKKVPLPLSVFDLNGISSIPENWVWILKDKEKVLTNSYSAFLSDYKTMEANQKELNLIRSSRWWKLRNKLRNLKIIKLILD